MTGKCPEKMGKCRRWVRLFLYDRWEGLFFWWRWDRVQGYQPVTKCRTWSFGPVEIRCYDTRKAALDMRDHWKTAAE